MSGLFNVPDHALTAWLELHEQILDAGGTPCAGPDRDDWTGNPTAQNHAATTCLDCPVMTACAAYADTANETSGVWGGRTARDRATQRRKDAA